MSRTMQKVIVASLIGLLVILGLLFLLWLSPWLAIKGVLDSAYAALVGASVPWRLAVALLALAGPPFVLALIRLTSAKAPFIDEKWPAKKMHAALIVCAYVGVFSVSMYFLTRRQVFGAGQARWVCTKEYEFYERDGVCPYHGRKLIAVTPELVETIDHVRTQGPPQAITLGPEGPFRSSANGDPLVWFASDPEGKLTPYGGPGFDAITGQPLRPADPELIYRYQAQSTRALEAAEAVRRADETARLKQDARRASHEALEREIGSLRRQIDGSPQDASLHYRLGTLLVQRGNSSEAIQAFKKALWYEPGHAGARAALARLGQ